MGECAREFGAVFSIAEDRSLRHQRQRGGSGMETGDSQRQKMVHRHPGRRLWEQEFGVPKAPGDTNAVPEMRRYALQEANYLRSRLTLYVQVTDATGKINKVLPIGPMISFGQPEPKVDKMSNLHLLYQNGPRSFSYTVINPDGEIIARQTYDYTTRPRLMADPSGVLTVVGGSRRITHDDLPPLNSSAGNDIPATTNP